jgi:peptide/nickel transport system permease protein
MKTVASSPRPMPPSLMTRIGAPISVMIAGALALLIVGCALMASWIAPYDPTDLASFELINAELPPAFIAEGDSHFLLGTDNQGRDLLSAMLYGARVSIAIGGGAVLVAATLGVILGLLAGYFGGKVDAAHK